MCSKENQINNKSLAIQQSLSLPAQDKQRNQGKTMGKTVGPIPATPVFLKIL